MLDNAIRYHRNFFFPFPRRKKRSYFCRRDSPDQPAGDRTGENEAFRTKQEKAGLSSVSQYPAFFASFFYSGMPELLRHGTISGI
ncbi:MAG TPA: hypothetical protein DE060_21470 [Lentisphaeria bacterium]|nr:hypothetical protein [Lentisphaeria bacterium]HCG51758.1 hypothetical protein [Lentisphaeria bacterium]